MENNSRVDFAEKLKAAAIGFIGAGIFSQGTFYFNEQTIYNVPRILYPVFKLLGNVGLAGTMLLLGFALIYWRYTKWKKLTGKPGTFILIAIASFAVFFSILFFRGKEKVTSADLLKTSEEKQQKGIDKINAMEKPDFGNSEIDQHFASFDKLLQEYAGAYKSKNEQEIAAKEDAYMDWSKNSAGWIQKLETPEQKQEFAL